MNENKKLIEVYDKLFARFGKRYWWPADTPFEVVIGAVLTQQTKWENVECAIRNLRERGLLEAGTLSMMDDEELEKLIRCTGFYRQKAKRLKNISLFFFENPDILERQEDELRALLLALNGIGDETADSSVLYAAGKPKFVIDAYTKRMCKCIGFEGDYRKLQSIFEGALPKDVTLYKEFHALIVEYGKRFCGKKRCGECIIIS